jgi:THO complex subunit 6
MIYSKENNLIYAGCGDNDIHIINLENGKILSRLSGHTSFIHSIALSYV